MQEYKYFNKQKRCFSLQRLFYLPVVRTRAVTLAFDPSWFPGGRHMYSIKFYFIPSFLPIEIDLDVVGDSNLLVSGGFIGCNQPIG